MNYYRRYSGDYLKKTARLSILEHGAYSLLLDYYYSDEEPLPADREEIYRLLRALTPPERKAIDKVLGMYFELREDGYHNERADEEIAIAQPAIEAARNNGKRGGRPPKKPADNPTDQPDENPPGYCMEEPDGLEPGIQPPTTNHHPPSANPQPSASDSTGSASTTSPTVALATALRAAGLPDASIMHPQVIEWAKAGVTIEQATEAVRIAREVRNNPKPKVAYLVGIIEDMRKPGKPLNGHAKPWFTAGWSQIVAKGAELGLEQQRDEGDAAYRLRVFEAAGVTEDMVRTAEKQAA